MEKIFLPVKQETKARPLEFSARMMGDIANSRARKTHLQDLVIPESDKHFRPLAEDW